MSTEQQPVEQQPVVGAPYIRVPIVALCQYCGRDICFEHEFVSDNPVMTPGTEGMHKHRVTYGCIHCGAACAWEFELRVDYKVKASPIQPHERLP